MLKVWQMFTSISQDTAEESSLHRDQTHIHVQTHSCTHACMHARMHACTHLQKCNGSAHIQCVYHFTTRCTQTCVNGAIVKVRPTLTVLCCCQPCRHVFKQVLFFRSLTYAGQQPHRHSSICWQASVSAL